MRKFVSPRAARKVLDTVNKTFGVPLEELLRQMPADGCTVPAAVKRICEYIYKHGIDQEGIFRVSGSARVVDKLKTSFNMNGDADLEGEGDIMAVGGLLKLFLRELPDSLIPEHLTQEFIAIETDSPICCDVQGIDCSMQLVSLFLRNENIFDCIIVTYYVEDFN